MAGHNKWSKIKRLKGTADAKRGRIFAKLSREITISSKLGGGNPDMNPLLRMALLGVMCAYAYLWLRAKFA